MFIRDLLYYGPIHSYIKTYIYYFIIYGSKGNRSHRRRVTARLQHGRLGRCIFFLQAPERHLYEFVLL